MIYNKNKNEFVYVDKKYNFIEMFNMETGYYERSGILEKRNGEIVDTNIDPFMRSMPALLDIGIMGNCIHGKSGLCIKSGVQCYQNGLKLQKPNMSFDDYKSIIDQCKGKLFQVALGGRGDVDQHENFEEILAYTRENNIIPNFTSSGLGFTKEIVDICKKYAGAIAISQYSRQNRYTIRRKSNGQPFKELYHIFIEDDKNYKELEDYIIDGERWEIICDDNKIYKDPEYDWSEVYWETNEYTSKAVQLLLDANITTNIHFVLGKNTIDEAIHRLKHNGFQNGINAVIFLLHKPIGLGSIDNVLDVSDPRLKEFFELVDNHKGSYKIGFDSCTIPGVINFCKNVNINSVDTCEAARYSGYIDAELNFMPCSFDNDAKKWSESLKNKTIEEIWNGEKFESFRQSFLKSCKGCKSKSSCMGGCPISREIVLCNREEKNLK